MRALSANTRELIDELYQLADEPVPRRNQAARQVVAVLNASRLGAAQRLLALGLAVPWRELLFDDHAGVRALAQQTALDSGGEPVSSTAPDWQRAVRAASRSR